MKQFLLLAGTAVSFDHWRERFVALIAHPQATYSSMKRVWQGLVEAHRPYFNEQIVELRARYIGSTGHERKRFSDDLFLCLEPHIKYRGGQLCEQKGWPDLSRRGREGDGYTQESKLETVDLIHTGSVGKLARDEWKNLRAFQGRCKFSTYLFCVVRSSRIDLLRQLYGTANRRSYQVATSLGSAGIKLFQLVYGAGVVPELAREELLNRHQIDLSEEEVADMLGRIGEVRRHLADPEMVTVASYDDDGKVIGYDIVDPAATPEAVLVGSVPIPLDAINKVTLNGMQRYLLKLRYPHGDARPEPVEKISRVLGRGYSDEKVRTMLKEIEERIFRAMKPALAGG